jgi:hypothetical protein
MPAVNKQQIVEEIASNISANYGIDDAIVNDFKTMMMNAMSQYYVYDQDQAKANRKVAKGKSASDAPKKPRKTSAYNVYVKKMMQSDDVKAVAQKEKMTKIGAMWKALTEDQRAAYKADADAENSANPALAGDTATEATTA